jgi:hypothetical protein
MKAGLLAALMVLCASTAPLVAQKKSTIVGDMVIGEVSAIDEAAREITIKYPGKQGAEIFTGNLSSGYKIKMLGREITVSEIPPGTWVRLFYKSGDETISGVRKKVNKVSRIDVLGKDQFVRLRNQLKVDPSTAVANAEGDHLPAASPLKVYLSIAYPMDRESVVDWIDKWNRKNSDSPGKFEIVPELAQADVLVVEADGADTMLAALPAEVEMNGVAIKGEWTQATSYIVLNERGSLKVLWTTVAPTLSLEKTRGSRASVEAIKQELEKRMKARTK